MCGAPITPGRWAKLKIFCGSECRRQKQRADYRRFNGMTDHEPTLPSATTGAISELVVSADLLRRGFHVFRALSPSCPCDLVGLDGNGKMIRFEVRTSSLSASGNPMKPQSMRDVRADVLAMVTRNKEITYHSWPGLEVLTPDP